MKLTKVKVKYKDKDGNEKTTYNFKLWYNDESFIVVKNVFKNDYDVLKAFALTESEKK